MKHDRLMVISIGGFIVNLIGIFVFHHGGSGKIILSPSLPPLSVVTAPFQVMAIHMATPIMDTIMDTHMDITTSTTMATHILTPTAQDRPRLSRVNLSSPLLEASLLPLLEANQGAGPSLTVYQSCP